MRGDLEAGVVRPQQIARIYDVDTADCEEPTHGRGLAAAEFRQRRINPVTDLRVRWIRQVLLAVTDENELRPIDLVGEKRTIDGGHDADWFRHAPPIVALYGVSLHFVAAWPRR